MLRSRSPIPRLSPPPAGPFSFREMVKASLPCQFPHLVFPFSIPHCPAFRRRGFFFARLGNVAQPRGIRIYLLRCPSGKGSSANVRMGLPWYVCNRRRHFSCCRSADSQPRTPCRVAGGNAGRGLALDRRRRRRINLAANLSGNWTIAGS